MAEVTNEIIYEILKTIPERMGRLEEGQRANRMELAAIRNQQLAMQQDIHGLNERVDSLEQRAERIERRLELANA